MTDALPLRIFLASPSDVFDERSAVSAAIDEYNARHRRETSIGFEVVDGERVRGTARRPQEAINELISESHFLVALFKGQWGSEPGSPWGYTSGTEEELFTGLLELGLADQPMRDVWVVFLEHSSPDDRVTRLKGQMSHNHSMMYEAIADMRELKEKLTERLESWGSTTEPKIPRHVDLLPSSGKEVLRAAKLRLTGQKLIDLGQAEAGRSNLSEAAAIGGPTEHLAYAKFLARQGELADAYTSTQQAIDQCIDGASLLYSPITAEAFAAQAGVLRRQGMHVDAIGRLEQALTLLDGQDAYAQRVCCVILDDLGLANQHIGDLTAARRSFEQALQIRRDANLRQEECQSLINLARLEVRARNLSTARAHADTVVAALQGASAPALHANAATLAAQVCLRQGRADEGLPHASRALALNRQIGSLRGEAISLLLLAQCSRAVGNLSEARDHARACLNLNQSMGDHAGAERAQWILDQVAA